MPSSRPLPPELSASLKLGGGLIRAADCRELGVSDDRIERMLRRGSLVALAKGVYADREQLAASSSWWLFHLRSRAFVLASPPNSYASDWSAAALHEMPTLPQPPAVPSVIRLGSRRSGSNRTLHGRTRFASVPDRWLTEVGGTGTFKPSFVAVDLGRRCDRRTGLMLADAAAARDGSCEGLAGALLDMTAWPRKGNAQWAVAHADPDAESALESVGRFAFLRAGLPPGLSNLWVGEGFPQFRLDHYWPEHRLAAEADGLEKYQLTDPAEAIRAEKHREWQLQEWGIRVVRYTWDVAFLTPDALTRRCAALMRADPMPACRSLQTWPRLIGYQMRGLTPTVAGWSGAKAGVIGSKW